MIKGGHYCPPLFFSLPIKFLHSLGYHHCILFCRHLYILKEIMNFTVFLNVPDYQLVMYYYMVLVSIYGVHNLIVNIINCKYAD